MAIVHFDYQTFKNTMDLKMAETADHFVMIGYLLKEARDTNILAESGYSSMGEFARSEYGLDESMTSRFISICEKYGNGEDRLLPQFEKFGYAKLSEMLTLPESVTEAITPEMTKEEIREIKAEVREEEKISDLEVRLEDQAETEDLLKEAIKAYLHEFPKDFKEIFECLTAGGDYKAIMSSIVPNGSATLMMRVSGVGRLMIRVESHDMPVKLINIRENTSKEYSIAEFTAAIDGVFGSLDGSLEEVWKGIYQEDMPVEKEESEEKPKKESREKKLKIAPAQKKKTPEINPPVEVKKEEPEKAAEDGPNQIEKQVEEVLPPAAGEAEGDKEVPPLAEEEAGGVQRDADEVLPPAAGQDARAEEAPPLAAGHTGKDSIKEALKILEAVPEGGCLEYEKVRQVVELIKAMG